MLCWFYVKCYKIYNFQKSSTFSSSVHWVFLPKFLDHQIGVFICFLTAVALTLSLFHRYPLLLNHEHCFITEASEPCSSLHVVQCTLRVILVGWPLLQKNPTVPGFLHLWMMALVVVRWSLKAIEILSSLLDVIFFFRLWDDVLPFSLLFFVRQVLFK